MDLSKLPKMSQTPKAPEDSDAAPEAAGGTPGEAEGERAAPVAPQRRPAYRGEAPDFYAGMGEIWFTLIVGIIFLLLGSSFARYLSATLSGKTYNTGVTWAAGNTMGHKADEPVSYWDLQGYTGQSDAALFIFGLAVVAEAGIRFTASRHSRGALPMLAIGLVLTVAGTLCNLVVAVKMWNYGLVPLMSLLAVAFGGMMLAFEWRLWQWSRQSGRAPH